MDAAEVKYRLQQQGALLALRAQGLVNHRGGELSIEPQAFSFCRSMRPQLPDPVWAAEAQNDAEGKLLAGEWPALGYPWRWTRGDEDVWRRAPDTRLLWPRRFFADIDIREGNSVGDVRIAWEPSRLQQLVSLALFARHHAGSHEGRAAIVLLEDQLKCWIDANPPWLGIHYSSAMECALRIIAVCHALDIARDQLTTPKPTWSAALRLVSTHAKLIARRLSLHSSCGNHTVAEAAGLVYAGVLYPEAPGSVRWRSVGVSVLSEQVDRQILADGGGIEQALGYHVFVLELVALVTRLLAFKGVQGPDRLLEAERRGRDFVHAISASRSDLPSVGDSDGGYALSPHLQLLWEEAPPLQPGVQVRQFSSTGLSLITDDRPVRLSVLFDHGPLGMPPNYGHGHADALAVMLTIAGEPLLVDPGTYTYTGEATWRRYFRGTGSHNTVCVDGLDQAEQVAAFMWRQPYKSRLAHLDKGGDKVRLLACHDGYMNLGVHHWRGIAYLSGLLIVVWDYLTGSGSHRSELHWLCAGDVVRGDNGLSITRAGSRLELVIEGGTLCLHSGGTSPPRGWKSKLYGILDPATALTSVTEAPLPHQFVTTIALRPEAGAYAAEVAAEVAQFRSWLS